MEPVAFGKYLLVERIAGGGMAEVYRATTSGAAGFEKTFALKRIHPAFSGEREFITMFIDEARLASRLTHGNIVQVFDFGEADGAYFLAMELVDGVDLSRLERACWSTGQPVPMPTAAHVCAEIASGLAFAHNQRDEQGRPLGVVHRDVSPQNILVSYSGEVKLADFGIAKAAGKLHVTTTGALIGKLRYMSPEQAVGHALDGRSDIFSLGAVLYELLTGRPPFDGEGTEVLERIKCDQVTPPRQLNAAVPEVLERITLKALARAPGDRYANAAQLSRELTAFVHATAPGFNRDDLAAFIRELAPNSSAQPSWPALPANTPPGAAPDARSAASRPGSAGVGAALGGYPTVDARPGKHDALAPTAIDHRPALGGLFGAAANPPAPTQKPSSTQPPKGARPSPHEPIFELTSKVGPRPPGAREPGPRRAAAEHEPSWADPSGTQGAGSFGRSYTAMGEPRPQRGMGRIVIVLGVVGIVATGVIAVILGYVPLGNPGRDPTPAVAGNDSGGPAPRERPLVAPAAPPGEGPGQVPEGQPAPPGTEADALARPPASIDAPTKAKLFEAWQAAPSARVATLGTKQEGYLLILWGASEAIARQRVDARGRPIMTPIRPDVRTKLSELRLEVAADRLIEYWRRTGELPDDFAVAARRFLKGHPAASNAGAREGAAYDATALSVWLQPNSAAHLEALIKARGARGAWEGPAAGSERHLNPSLCELEAATARLRRLDPQSRLLSVLGRYAAAEPADREVSIKVGAGQVRFQLLAPSPGESVRTVRLRISTTRPGIEPPVGAIRLRDATDRHFAPLSIPALGTSAPGTTTDVALSFSGGVGAGDNDVLILEFPSNAPRAGGRAVHRSLRLRATPLGELAPVTRPVEAPPSTPQPPTTAPAPADAGVTPRTTAPAPDAQAPSATPPPSDRPPPPSTDPIPRQPPTRDPAPEPPAE